MPQTLYERLQDADPKTLRHIAEVAGGAAYVVDPNLLGQNVAVFRQALLESYGNASVAYSFKTNYLSHYVEAARRSGALSEVVSTTELDYAARCLNIPDSEIILNGPGKPMADLRDIIKRRMTVILDSVNELERVNSIAQKSGHSARIGLRCNPQLSFMKGCSRFGVDLQATENRQAINNILKQGHVKLSGIHLHFTGDRSAASFVERLNHLIDSWRALDIGPPSFIDCGGGFASSMPDEIRNQLPYPVDSLEDYGSLLGRTMKSVFPDEKVELIVEPGTGILSDTGVFMTPVLDTKSGRENSIAIVDGTIFTLNPQRSPAAPVLFRVANASRSKEVMPALPTPFDVTGNSCMEIDVLARGVDIPMSTGDLLVFAQKGAYAACMAAPFIQGIPAVVALDENGGFSLLRERTTADLLFSLNHKSTIGNDGD